MAYLELDDGQMFYESQGKGEPILILRGLGRSSRYWMGFDQDLAQYFNVITVDFRSIGRSTAKFRWGDSITSLADDLYVLMRHLNLESWHVFGLSLGGMVSMEFASKYPEHCRSLFVANSSSGDYLGMRVSPVALIKVGVAALKGQIHEELIRLVTTPMISTNQGGDISKEWAEIRQEEGFPLTTIGKQLLAASRFRIKGKINPHKVPLMFLVGSQDNFVPPYNTRRLHQVVPGSQFKKIRSVGHEISIGDQGELLSIIKGFIEKVSVSPSTSL